MPTNIDLRIKDLPVTGSGADMTSANYLAVDGLGGTKKVPADVANLQTIYPAVDTQATIWSKVSNHTGDVVVAVPRVDGESPQLSYNVYHQGSTEVTSGGYVMTFYRAEGNKVYTATCTMPNVQATTLATWSYGVSDLVGSNLTPATDISAVDIVAKDKTTGEVVKVDGHFADTNISNVSERYFPKDVIEVDESCFAEVVVDSNRKILKAILKDGTCENFVNSNFLGEVYFDKGFETKGKSSVVFEESGFNLCEDFRNDDVLIAEVDSSEKVHHFVDKSGIHHFPAGIKSPTIEKIEKKINDDASWNSSALFKTNPFITKNFGICSHIVHRDRDASVASRNLDLIERLGFSFVRADFPFEEIHPDSNTWNWTNADAAVALMEKHQGVKILPLITAHKSGDYTYGFNHQELLAEYIVAVVNRYKDKVKYWECLNEYNNRIVPSQLSYSDYASLHKLVYNTIKNNDDKSVVLFGSLMTNVDTNFLNQMRINNALDGFYDIMNFHCYSSDIENSLKNNLDNWISFCKENNLTKKQIWLTEVGRYIREEEESEKKQAFYNVRAMISSVAYGVEKAFIYNFRDNPSASGSEANYGIVKGNFEAKKSFFALENLNQIMKEGCSRPFLVYENGCYKASWKIDGNKIFALWSLEPKVVNVKCDSNAVAYDFMDFENPIESKVFSLDNNIIFVKNTSTLDIN